MNRNRREFLADVGKGMLVAGVGPALATELGFAPASHAEEEGKGLTFGDREPLVAMMQETPLDKLLPVLVEKLNAGTSLDALVTAAALANARTFGGEDYIGFHAFMALLPAHRMAAEIADGRKPLPVLKVLFRNTQRIQAFGGRKNEVLRPVTPADLPKDRPAGEVLRDATRAQDKDKADAVFAAIMTRPTAEAFDELRTAVDDDADVHRIVLAWRAWAMLDLAGKEHAHTMLRQSVRFCGHHKGNWHPEVRTLVPKLLDQYKLLGRPLGTRTAEDAWVARLAAAILSGGGAKACDAVAAALGEGFSIEAVGEALSLATCDMLLADTGRLKQHANAAKPEGSVHGDSYGVHASDAINAWRNVARVGGQRAAVVSLLVAAHFAADRGTPLAQPHPRPDLLEKITTKDAAVLLREAEEAIQAREQGRACALIHRYGELGLPARPAFDLLLRYAISSDGALHAEKYYATVAEEYATARPAFRWRQVVALARVTASQSGAAAPGYAEACKLLKV